MRYSRQIILKEFGISGQKKIKDTTVLIIGIGGIGCQCAMQLSLVGIGRIILADYDVVEKSNLNRQFLYKEKDIGLSKSKTAKDQLFSLNPNVEYIYFSKKIFGKKLKSSIEISNIVLDCSDDLKTRYLINRYCIEYNKVFITGSCILYSVQILVFRSFKYGCYACVFPRIKNNYTCQNYGIFISSSSLAGTLQAMEAIKIALNFKEEKKNYLFSFDIRKMRFKKAKIFKDKYCKFC
ncbi:HesA/MoeB/ThiF family protein [bacterium endosymbiont of Pedicinus badii]|uniref:HesA/MoeB/ThiF family protein n=1 Tax=bacterium endosymbiont of Pedicinus badii TaxID=1719126 RepID=UPI0018A843D6|nr:HesA/MoeB/ThiF family protein [bacterium endosymbiont of Pedicinus badii]